MKKRILSLILTLTLAFSLLPAATAFAASGGIYLSVNGTDITSVGQTVPCGSGTATFKWRGDYPALVLSNAEITKFCSYSAVDGTPVYAGIQYEGSYELYIVLEGTNTISAPTHTEGIYRGIDCSGSVMVCSDTDNKAGALKIEGVDDGIVCLGEEAGISFNSCASIDVEASEMGMYACNIDTGYSSVSVFSSGTAGVYAENLLNVSAPLSVTMNTDAEKYNTAMGIKAAEITGDCADVSLKAKADASNCAEDTFALVGIYAESMQGVNVKLNAELLSSAFKGETAQIIGIYGDYIGGVKAVDVSLNGRDADSAVGIMANKCLCSENCLCNVRLSGGHLAAAAISANAVEYEVEAHLYGAGAEDCAVEITSDEGVSENARIYATTDCDDSLCGAMLLNSEKSIQNVYITYPAKGSAESLEYGDVSLSFIADKNGDAAKSVVVSGTEYSFRDVDGLIYDFRHAIAWAAGEEIVNGYSPVTFKPNNTCTRGQIVTMLWRSMGCPEPQSGNNPFTDVSETGSTAPFYKAILWAYENGITTGMTKTEFCPGAGCTRAQAVTFLWRVNGCPEPQSTANPFKDVSSSSVYYKAILWASENSIVSGYNGGVFKPGGLCTRAHIATFIYRAAAANKITDVEITPFPETLAENPLWISPEDDPRDFVDACNIVPVNLTVTYGDGSQKTMGLEIQYYGGGNGNLPENWLEVISTCDSKGTLALKLYSARNDKSSIIGVNLGKNSAKIAVSDCVSCDACDSYVVYKTSHKLLFVYDLTSETTSMVYVAPTQVCIVGDFCIVGSEVFYVGDENTSDGKLAVYRANLKTFKTTCSQCAGTYDNCTACVFDETGWIVTRTVNGESVTTHYNFS